MGLRFCFTRPDGGVSVVSAAPKDSLERVLGPLTDEEYRSHVLERSIPVDATKVREISDVDIPADRKYRNAWADITPASKIDLDNRKIKELLLTDLRLRRDAKLAASDVLIVKGVETGADLTNIKQKRQALRDATNNLKAVTFSAGTIVDDVKLQELESAADVVLEDPTL